MSLPLHLLLLAPGLLFIWTRSRVVLAAFIATYPLLLLLRLFFARLLSRLAEPTVIDLAFKADGKGNAAPPTNGLESDAYSGHAAPYDETSVMYITFRKG